MLAAYHFKLVPGLIAKTSINKVIIFLSLVIGNFHETIHTG